MPSVVVENRNCRRKRAIFVRVQKFGEFLEKVIGERKGTEGEKGEKGCWRKRPKFLDKVNLWHAKWDPIVMHTVDCTVDEQYRSYQELDT